MIHILIPTTAERRDRLRECVDLIHENAGYPHIISTYENYREGFITPIHKLLQDLKPETLVWCIGDDTRVREPDTLKKLVEAFETAFPERDGVVNPNDGIQCGNIITMPLCTAHTMAAYTHKDYFLNYADNEFTIIMTAKGKYLYCPEVNVEHAHHVNKKAPLDDTYAHANTKVDDDRLLFEQRKATNFGGLI